MRTIRVKKNWIIQILFWNIILLSVDNLNAQNIINYNSVDTIIRDYISENDVPGFAISVIKNNEIIWTGVYGEANIESHIPMTINSLMNIGSISKTITTTAAMQLWEKGLIDLDTDINEYINIIVKNPFYPEIPITIRHILTHTSSIRDGSAYDNGYSCGDPKISLEDWIKNYFALDGQYYDKNENFNTWAPGSKSDYSNVAFGLLGYIIEEICQIPFHEYCKRNIFIPLGMLNTGWFLNEIDTINHVIPYKYIFDKHLLKEYNQNKEQTTNKNVPLCYYSFPNYPDGLVRTSVHELSFFLISIMNDGKYNDTQILKKSTIQEMLKPQIADNNYQGLCWGRWWIETLWGHSGADPGIRTHLHFDPITKTGVITFQNNDNGDAFRIVKEIYLLTKN